MEFKALAAASVIALSASAAHSQDVIEMTSSFGKNLPILGTAAIDFVEKINSISEGVEFEHFDPGEL
ncbi:MAG: C4-dicarboxylate ABC transporter, partial [Pseudomonadota bacterium]